MLYTIAVRLHSKITLQEGQIDSVNTQHFANLH